MDLTALLLSRLQFGSTVAFHIIFPSFTIGLAAWLTVLEALHLWTGRPVYRLVFEFWLKIFGVAFGLGVVSGIVMAFQFGTNWSVLARMSGPIQGPLLILRDLHRVFPGSELFRHPAVWPPSRRRRGFTCFRPRWWRWARRSRRSGSWPTTAGCRCRSAMRSRTASSFRMTGPRSSSVRSCGCASRICCLLRTSPALFASPPPGHGTCCAGICRRGAHHASHGLVSRGRAGSGPAFLRTPQRRICRSPPAVEDGSDRGPVAGREAGFRGAARAGRMSRSGETCSRSRCRRRSGA